MTFLSKIRGMMGSGEQPEEIELPIRNRTFSATQFREEELARAAEIRAHAEAVKIDAAEVLSPAINPVAENLIAEQESLAPDVEDFEADEGVSDAGELSGPNVAAAVPELALPKAPLVIGDPMPWDEAVGWLSQRSADTRNFVGQYWNWDYDLRVLHFLAQQPDLDAGVAAHIFWLTAASEDYFPFGDDEPSGDVAGQIAWLTHFLGRRFAEGAFRPASYGFDDSWDCDRLKEHLVALHGEGRLDWSPENIPTSSTAELMSFDDIPEDERAEVMEFLGRFGVH